LVFSVVLHEEVLVKLKPIKVLVVEDSNVVRTLLVHLLNSDERIQVVGTAKTGREALHLLDQTPTDLILMDIEMPEMDGFEATRRIMETKPLPIVICCGSGNPHESISTFRLMEAGAVACVEKPRGTGHKDFAAMAAHLLQTVKLMSEVKVVRRWPHLRRDPAAELDAAPPIRRASQSRIEYIGIGASTGGPPVLQTILAALPADFSVPILIVQHISPGFLGGLVEWLNQTTACKIHIAAHGTQPRPGHVYFAPDDFHMALRPGGTLALTREEPDSRLRPSVAHLFHSLAGVCGASAVGVLLTGMGKDGAAELKEMHDKGAVTIVQDRESSIVHGMPGEAIALGAASHVLPPDRIAPALAMLVHPRTPGAMP
jgi:two-component system chemotaxis response regulator CheB